MELTCWPVPPVMRPPFISLRGVPVMSYLGSEVLSAELEVGYQFTSRWSGIVFGGTGTAEIPELEDFQLDSSPSVSAYGVGFRYVIARQYGMRTGIDIATNSDGGNAIYFQFGSAW